MISHGTIGMDVGKKYGPAGELQYDICAAGNFLSVLDHRNRTFRIDIIAVPAGAFRVLLNILNQQEPVDADHAPDVRPR